MRTVKQMFEALGPATMTAPPLNRWRILYVDDDEAARRAFRRQLREYEVTTVAGGEQALALLGMQTFDGVVLDIRMPGLDGFELLERIRARSPSLPVVMLTGLAHDEAIYRSVKLGCSGFVEKPYTKEALLSQIEGAFTQAYVRGLAPAAQVQREEPWQPAQ